MLRLKLLFEPIEERRNGHQCWIGWWNHRNASPPNHPPFDYFLALVAMHDISLKVRDSRRLLPLYHKPIRLLSCLEQACEHMMYKYIFSSEVQVCTDGGAFWRKSAYQACLISLWQFVKSKEAKERERDAQRERELPKVEKPQDCWSCQIHSPARVVLSQSTQLGDSPWSGEPNFT